MKTEFNYTYNQIYFCSWHCHQGVCTNIKNPWKFKLHWTFVDGWNESHPYCISLKCQRYMTFTPPYQQILTDISMFAVFCYEDLMFYGKHIPTPTVGTIHSHITDSKLHWLRAQQFFMMINMKCTNRRYSQNCIFLTARPLFRPILSHVKKIIWN